MENGVVTVLHFNFVSHDNCLSCNRNNCAFSQSRRVLFRACRSSCDSVPGVTNWNIFFGLLTAAQKAISQRRRFCRTYTIRHCQENHKRSNCCLDNGKEKHKRKFCEELRMQGSIGIGQKVCVDLLQSNASCTVRKMLTVMMQKSIISAPAIVVNAAARIEGPTVGLPRKG